MWISKDNTFSCKQAPLKFLYFWPLYHYINANTDKPNTEPIGINTDYQVTLTIISLYTIVMLSYWIAISIKL